MRKSYTFVILIIMLFISSCAPKYVTSEQSKLNFTEYQKAITDVAHKYNCTVKDESDIEHCNDYEYKDLIVIINENDKINISLINNKQENTGLNRTEYFFVDYIQDNNSKQFNLDLFSDLINVISGKKITSKTCIAFLNNDKYIKETSEFLVVERREHSLNFWEDWGLDYKLYYTGKSYEQYSDNVGKEILSYAGLTKYGTRKINTIMLFIICLFIIVILTALSIVLIISRHKKRKQFLESK